MYIKNSKMHIQMSRWNACEVGVFLSYSRVEEGGGGVVMFAFGLGGPVTRALS